MSHKLYVVGLGPGAPQYLTAQARLALEEAQILCGYTVYVALVSGLFPEKECYTTPMGQELDRCRWALERAAGGKTVALVCSGDAGVYGMAGPVLQLAPEWPQVEVAVVPGVTAALSGGALLGAPIGHDFCVISLSDLLTPWEVIEKRLRCGAEGDFPLCLYNPASHNRRDVLRRACDILLAAGADPQTLCGYVRNIGRPGEETALLSLAQLREAELDMVTTVFIGCSTTLAAGGRMITPRGYERKGL
ncbi:MAG: precorrin-3B C(17)-methyltransferase [Oscillospiraceae bacterium]|nr:precorrin-3B C(17)-methyltransferase [Oscillospiraceae bacterium]